MSQIQKIGRLIEYHAHYQMAYREARKLGIFSEEEYFSKSKFSLSIYNDLDHPVSQITLEQCLENKARLFYERVLSIWILICQSNLKIYKKGIEDHNIIIKTWGKVGLISLKSANAPQYFEDRLKEWESMLALIIRHPPKLQKYCDDNWDECFVDLKSINESATNERNNLYEIAKNANKEIYDIKSARRGRISIALSAIGGGGLVGILMSWKSILAIIAML